MTLGLTFGALLVIAGMHIASQVAPPGSPFRGVESWVLVDLQILGNAAAGGVIADAFRWVAGTIWQSCRRTTPTTLFASRIRRSPVS